MSTTTTPTPAPAPAQKQSAYQGQINRNLTAFFTPLTTITSSPVHWLWPGRIPVGKLTLICGQPEIGKSFCAADIAARVTAGLPWPDGSPATRPADVLICAAEDDLADTVLPRLAAAGADIRRTFALRSALDTKHRPVPFTFPMHLPGLEEALDRCPNPRLLILDPLAAYLGPAGEFGAEIQSRLTPLIALAAPRNVAVLAITHRDLRPAHAPYAAHSLFACARVVHHLSCDPRNRARRILIPIKNNLAPNAPPLAFTLAAKRLIWEQQAPPSANAAATPSSASETAALPADPTELQFATDWLASLLRNGPVLHGTVIAQARELMISYATLRRAHRLLGVRSHRADFHGPVSWQLPPDPTTPQTPTNLEQVCTR